MTYDEMIAVIEAAKAGKKIEFCLLDCKNNLVGGWVDLEEYEFDFFNHTYRVKPSPVAAGHNPDKLTEEQVGISEGWRLLALNEVAIRGDEQLTSGEWIKISVTYPIEKYMPCAVRAKRPLHPKETRRVLRVSELPPFVQIKNLKNGQWNTVTTLCGDGTCIAGFSVSCHIDATNADNYRWRTTDGVERSFWIEEEAK